MGCHTNTLHDQFSVVMVYISCQAVSAGVVQLKAAVALWRILFGYLMTTLLSCFRKRPVERKLWHFVSDTFRKVIV
jgi:hypothetical protein